MPENLNTLTSVLFSVSKYPKFKEVRSWESKVCITLHGIPSQSYRAQPAVWDHKVVPATQHEWMHLALTSARQAGVLYLPTVQG